VDRPNTDSGGYVTTTGCWPRTATCAQYEQLLQRNIEQRLGGVRQHTDAREILMLSGMMRIRCQKASLAPLTNSANFFRA
jgi:hypothetical protein